MNAHLLLQSRIEAERARRTAAAGAEAVKALLAVSQVRRRHRRCSWQGRASIEADAQIRRVSLLLLPALTLLTSCVVCLLGERSQTIILHRMPTVRTRTPSEEAAAQPTRRAGTARRFVWNAAHDAMCRPSEREVSARRPHTGQQNAITRRRVRRPPAVISCAAHDFVPVLLGVAVGVADGCNPSWIRRRTASPTATLYSPLPLTSRDNVEWGFITTCAVYLGALGATQSVCLQSTQPRPGEQRCGCFATVGRSPGSAA